MIICFIRGAERKKENFDTICMDCFETNVFDLGVLEDLSTNFKLGSVATMGQADQTQP